MSEKELFIKWAKRDLETANFILKWSVVIGGILVGSAIGLTTVGIVTVGLLRRSAYKQMREL